MIKKETKIPPQKQWSSFSSFCVDQLLLGIGLAVECG